MQKRESVIVIGAGVSGLACARELCRQGFEVVVLEARARVGGRVWSDEQLGFPIDMGAGWIMGHESNPLTEIARDSRFALRMLAGLSRRLHGLVSDVQAYALQNGVQRVIGYLLRDQAMDDERADDAVTVSLPVSKATLASRLSLTPEYFSRVLRELEDAKLIEVDRRDIRIPDVKRLSAYTG